MGAGQFFHGLDEPYYQGVGSSSETPGLFPVALGGRPYLIDLKSGDFNRTSIPILRNQADTANLPGEQSLNPEELWRRAQEDWTHGAGQVHLDRPISDPSRFRTSKGVHVWDRWELELLPDTDEKKASANTNLALVSAGARLYLTDGTSIQYTTNITVGSPTWTDITGEPATAANSITSDGFNVWTSHGADRIFRTDTGSSSTAAYITSGDGADIVAYVKGRLMAAGTGANKHKIYNITASGAMPAALFTHNNTDFTWIGFAEGPGFIYAAGFSGDKSLVYRTAIRADGTSLDIPVVAAELPDGEIIRSIFGYLGFMVLGTDRGVRFATIDGTGNLVLGPVTGSALNGPASAVRAFEPQDRFVWFGWTNFDGTSTGLGRLDLSVFTDPLRPAFASDLMTTAQGNVLSIATFQNVRVFTVNAVGVFAEDTNLVSSGTLDTGFITYGMPDTKTAIFLDLQHAALVGTIRADISTNEGSFEIIGTSSTAAEVKKQFPAGQKLGERFELRFTLTRSASAPTTGPSLRRYTLRSHPEPDRGTIFTVPLILHERLDVADVVRPMDVKTEYDALIGFRDGKKLVTYQEGEEIFSVFVEDFQWQPHHLTEDGTWWNGVMVLRLKEVI